MIFFIKLFLIIFVTGVGVILFESYYKSCVFHKFNLRNSVADGYIFMIIDLIEESSSIDDSKKRSIAYNAEIQRLWKCISDYPLSDTRRETLYQIVLFKPF